MMTTRVPEGVEEIDEMAFKNRPNLREIDIPYTVEWHTDSPMCNDAMRYAPKARPKVKETRQICKMEEDEDE